jgi:predicted ester cyclase
MLYRVADEAITLGNFALLDELYAPDFVQHNPQGSFNLEQTKALLGALRNALTDFRVTRELVLVDGDYGATRTVLRGVFETALPTAGGAVPPNGKPVELHINNVWRFNEDGKIAVEWAQFDNLGFLVQLGIMLPPQT